MSQHAFIEAAIKRDLRQSGGDEPSASYCHPNGRSFDIRSQDDGSFFLSEMIPTGAFQTTNGGIVHDPRIKTAAENPNGCRDAIIAAGLDPATLFHAGGGYGVYSRYLPDLRSVVDAILTAIETNVRYDHQDRDLMADAGFAAELAKRTEESQRQFRIMEAELDAAAIERESGIFIGLRHMMGPLGDETKLAILSYLNEPTDERWDAIASTTIAGFTTLWQAWAAIDPKAPRSLEAEGKWPRIPDPETVRSAMRHVAAKPAPGATDAPAPASAPIIPLRL